MEKVTKTVTDSVIYAIEHIVSGKRYVGSAINFKRRQALHVWALSRDRHYNPHLQHAWNKYGADAFQFLILEVIEDKSIIYAREQWWIDQASDRYNICEVAGSALGRKATEETRQKLREARKGYKHDEAARQAIKDALARPGTREKMKVINKGRKHTAEARANMSRGQKGRVLSAETRQKMSEAHKGYVRSPEHQHKLTEAMKGHVKKPETLEKLRIAGQKRFASPEGQAKLREMAMLSKLSRIRKNTPIGGQLAFL